MSEAGTVVVFWQLKGVLAEHVTELPATCCRIEANVRPNRAIERIEMIELTMMGNLGTNCYKLNFSSTWELQDFVLCTLYSFGEADDKQGRRSPMRRVPQSSLTRDQLRVEDATSGW